VGHQPDQGRATRVRCCERVHYPEGATYVDTGWSRSEGLRDDAELIALVRQTQDQFEAHGELNELNVLLRDFARELLKQCLLAKGESVNRLE
jgi:predicted metal-dependent hydrolase